MLSWHEEGGRLGPDLHHTQQLPSRSAVAWVLVSWVPPVGSDHVCVLAVLESSCSPVPWTSFLRVQISQLHFCLASAWASTTGQPVYMLVLHSPTGVRIGVHALLTHHFAAGRGCGARALPV